MVNSLPKQHLIFFMALPESIGKSVTFSGVKVFTHVPQTVVANSLNDSAEKFAIGIHLSQCRAQYLPGMNALIGVQLVD